MGRYRTYPEYQDSGVEWLRKVPKGWELRKSKYLFLRVQRVVRSDDDIVTAFRDGQVTLRSNRRIDGFTNALKEIGYQGVRKGDLLVHAMDGFAGAIGVSDSDGKCSPVCSVCIPREKNCIYMPYYGYLVRQLAVTDYITSLAKGIRERSTEFRFNEFAVLTLTLPSFVEQQQIANFLDHETAKIDTLINKQQQLISLLKEKRQAVISHAVTKGLNPEAPMKDSGVEWLGEVPEHWKISRAKYVSHIFIPQRNKPDLNDTAGIAWATMEDMKSRYIDTTTHRVEENAAKNAGSKILPAGAVIASCVGSFGVTSINKVDVIINQQLQAFIPNKINAEYLSYLVMLSKTYFELIGTAATLIYVNQQGFENMPVVVPPLVEQIKIFNYVEGKLNQFESLISKTAQTIDLMQERRIALISSAVTGKIDVRNWQPPALNTTKKG